MTEDSPNHKPDREYEPFTLFTLNSLEKLKAFKWYILKKSEVREIIVPLHLADTQAS